jgi:hypothetical protein
MDDAKFAKSVEIGRMAHELEALHGPSACTYAETLRDSANAAGAADEAAFWDQVAAALKLRSRSD